MKWVSFSRELNSSIKNNRIWLLPLSYTKLDKVNFKICHFTLNLHLFVKNYNFSFFFGFGNEMISYSDFPIPSSARHSFRYTDRKEQRTEKKTEQFA